MARKRGVEPAARSKSLHIAASFTEAWQEVVQAWCERVGPAAWKTELPSLVIAPGRGQINALKARLAEHGASQLGLHFVTAAALRRLLRSDDSAPHPATADLRLALAIAASKEADSPNESEKLAAKAVARSPGPLLGALERLGRAGWDFSELQMKSFAPVITRFSQLRKEAGLLLAHELERQWIEQAQAQPPRFNEILIIGFNGAHWSHWLLLQAAVESARGATIILEEPRVDMAEPDLCWIGSWEQICGEAKRPVGLPRSNGDTLFSEAEMRGGPRARPLFEFLVGTTASEQAEAVVLQCLRYLAEKSCRRLGVIFPAAGALPRLVSQGLTRLEIPHNDGIGHGAPGLFESNEWRAWIELQRMRRLDPLLAFINALPDPTVLLGRELSRAAFEDALRESYTEVLLDDLDVIREFCAAQSAAKFKRTAEALRRIALLPAEATANEFIESTTTALTTFGWKQQAFEIGMAARPSIGRLDAAFTRSLFLRWLDETAASFGLERSAAGDHPYARVQLLQVSDAQNQDWSHLIFVGWNEGEWPPPAGNEFAREEEIRAFNRRVQQLNKRAAQQGAQGEGHTAIREGHALYLGPLEQRSIALHQFDALVESATESVTIAASLVHDDAPERSWNPSECLTRCYLETQRQPLNEQALKSLQRKTAAWIENADVFSSNAKSSDDGLEQTLIAFQARRDPSTPIGEYDFGLRRQSHSHIPIPTLSVSDLEAMVSTPALVWMKRYLGVKPAEDLSNPWAATSGKWVHRWLAGVRDKGTAGLFVRFPSAEALDAAVRGSADERRRVLQTLCDSLGKPVPDWWISGWLNARYLARHLGARIATISGWEWITTELPVGRENSVTIAPKVELHLRGQADLVLAQSQLTGFADANLWVIDYKTGSTKELKPADLHDSLVKGVTLQLGLYALALQSAGAKEVGASIVSLLVKSIKPQLSAADLEPHTNVFADLSEMQHTGIFGMKGEIRPAFGYGAAYPLATLAIDRDVLEDKWELTHPNLVVEKEEWETW